MYKGNEVYTYNEILFDLKTECNSDTGYKMDEPWEHLLKQTKPETKQKCCMIWLLWNIYNVCFCFFFGKKESQLAGGEDRVIISRWEVSVWNNDNVLEMDCVMVAQKCEYV